MPARKSHDALPCWACRQVCLQSHRHRNKVSHLRLESFSGLKGGPDAMGSAAGKQTKQFTLLFSLSPLRQAVRGHGIAPQANRDSTAQGPPSYPGRNEADASQTNFAEIYPVWSIAITSNGKQLAAATADAVINLWSADCSRKELIIDFAMISGRSRGLRYGS